MIIAELVYKITGDTKAAEAGLAKTDKTAEKSAKSLNKVKIGALAVAAAAVGVGIAFSKMVSNQLKVIDAEAKLADRLGITMEAMAGLNHIAGLTGVSTESIGTAMQGLERRMGDAAAGIGGAGQAVQALGLSMNEVKNLEPEEAFFAIAESLQQVEDRTEQARLGNELFGRGWMQLSGVIRSSGGDLKSLSEEAKSLGLAISRSAAAEVEKFNDNMFRLSQRSEGVKRQITIQLMPSLNRLADAFITASEEGGWFSDAMETLSGWVSATIDGIARLVEQLNIISGSASDLEVVNDAIKRQEILINQSNSALTEYGESFVKFLGVYVPEQDKATKSQQDFLNKLKEQRDALAKIEAEEKKNRPKRNESIKDQNDGIDDTNKKLTEEEAKIEAINFALQKTGEVIGEINNYTQIGMGVLSALGELSAAKHERKIALIDEQMQAELFAAGLAEETQVEQAQREYDAAVATGNALNIEEKRRALEKAKIEDKYRKQKLEAEYAAAIAAWEFKRIEAAVQMHMGIGAAIASGAQAGFPLAFAMMPLLASIAALQGGIQLAAVQAGKPRKPKFATGGIVPGSSYSGDRVEALVNSREMVLTEAQQANLFNLANSGGGGGTQVIIHLGGQKVYDEFHRASTDGRLIVDARAVV